MDQARSQSGPIPARLGLLDAVSIIVGIIIGVGIFETPPLVFQNAPGPWSALGLWLLGGLLALVGAFCFAELATAYPRSGGEYVYLTRAYGPLSGFLFAWAQLTIIRPGSIGALAFIFAEHACRLCDLDPSNQLLIACLVITVPTLINILGVTLGMHTQNLLTVLKLLGLGAIICVGFTYGSVESEVPANLQGKSGWFAASMILVLWSYAGWQEAAYIATEVKNGRRNLPLALLLGTAAVTCIYLLVNIAYWLGLGFAGSRSDQAATDIVGLALPRIGPQALNVLVMISALGAINGMVFTTARIFSEFGADHRLFVSLSHWSRRLQTPARALAFQGIITLVLAVGIGIWGKGRDSFEKMIYLTAAVFWIFFLMTGVALFILRTKDADHPRPFRAPAYPWLPAGFCLMCAYMLVGSLIQLPMESLIGLGLLVLGIPLYFLPKKWKRMGQAEPAPARAPQPVGVPCANR